MKYVKRFKSARTVRASFLACFITERVRMCATQTLLVLDVKAHYCSKKIFAALHKK